MKNWENVQEECPKCKSKKVLRITYGLISRPEDLAEDEIPGGCIVTDNSPDWHCGDCHWEWGVNCQGAYNEPEE